jgi:GT2 family glycosyltransferase
MFFQSTVFQQQANNAWFMPTEQGRADAAGMYQIVGQVCGHERAYSTVLTVSLLNNQSVDVDILVTKSGRILEMLEVPSGIRAIKWRTSSVAPVNIQITLSLRKISWLEYRFRQFRRAIPAYQRQTPQRRASVGFKLSTLFTDIDYAYLVSCRFRANAYMRSYADWRTEFYTISPDDRRLILKRIRQWQNPPHFQLFILVDENDKGEGDAIASNVDKQIYPHFSRILTSSKNWLEDITLHAQATPHDLSVGPKWNIVLRSGTRLSEAALYWIAETIQKDLTNQADVVYTDDDVIGEDGRLSLPNFKPDWSRELLRATNYIGDAFAWRADAPAVQRWDISKAAAYSIEGAIHSLLLALTASPCRVAHICAPLWHQDYSFKHQDITDGFETSRIVEELLLSHNIKASVRPTGPGRCHVTYSIPDVAPQVSIIIPTRDGLSHLQLCIDSLLTKTTYKNYEIIIVDNQSELPETLVYLQNLVKLPNVRVLAFDEPFNYSKINNYAVSQAKGELICLLNNDTEVISPDWLTQMVGVVLQPGIGAVGAKLLYGNDTVQHGGDTVGPGGCANHLHSGIGRDDPGYAGRALVAQDLSAVTAACLLTRKDLYQKLAGLNEVKLTVAFNDVDFCLRIRECGLRVIWTPHALLYHHESITRGKDTSPVQVARAKAEVDYMRKRWAHLMQHDPFYNPNLNYQHPDFGLNSMPHVIKPWSKK